MRNLVIVTTLLVRLVAWPELLRAQNPSPALISNKIAVINIQEAIANSAEGKKAFADLQKKYQPRRQELERQQQEINALQDQIQRQGPTLSDEERVRLSRELEDKQKMLKRSQEDATADFQADQQDLLRRIGQKMVRVINEYAQQNSFSLVMDDSQMPVIYVARDAEITEEILKRFDAANPVTDSPEAAPAATSPTKPPASQPSSTAPKPPSPAKPPAKPKP